MTGGWMRGIGRWMRGRTGGAIAVLFVSGIISWGVARSTVSYELLRSYKEELKNEWNEALITLDRMMETLENYSHHFGTRNRMSCRREIHQNMRTRSNIITARDVERPNQYTNITLWINMNAWFGYYETLQPAVNSRNECIIRTECNRRSDVGKEKLLKANVEVCKAFVKPVYLLHFLWEGKEPRGRNITPMEELERTISRLVKDGKELGLMPYDPRHDNSRRIFKRMEAIEEMHDNVQIIEKTIKDHERHFLGNSQSLCNKPSKNKTRLNAQKAYGHEMYVHNMLWSKADFWSKDKETVYLDDIQYIFNKYDSYSDLIKDREKVLSKLDQDSDGNTTSSKIESELIENNQKLCKIFKDIKKRERAFQEFNNFREAYCKSLEKRREDLCVFIRERV